MFVDMFQVLLAMFFPLILINEDPFGGKCVCVGLVYLVGRTWHLNIFAIQKKSGQK